MLNRIMTVMSLGLVLAIGVMGCGSGDGMENPRLNPVEFVTGDAGTGGGLDGGGGGGGATGACVLTSMGACYGNVTNSICQQIGSGMVTPSAWTNGATCQSLGYTFCSQVGGYTVCM